MDKAGSPTLLNCLMYKMSYYRFGEMQVGYISFPMIFIQRNIFTVVLFASRKLDNECFSCAVKKNMLSKDSIHPLKFTFLKLLCKKLGEKFF